MSKIKFYSSIEGEGTATFVSPSIEEDIQYDLPKESGEILLKSFIPEIKKSTNKRPLVSDGTKLDWGNPIKQVGEFLFWGSNLEPEGRFVLCDGRIVSRTGEFENLFNVIGTTYGKGDGKTTFNLPNFIGRTVWGGSEAGQYLSPGLPNVVSEESSRFYYNTTNSGISPKTGALQETQYSEDFGNSSVAPSKSRTIKLDLSKGNPIYGNSNTVQPPALVMKIYITY